VAAPSAACLTNTPRCGRFCPHVLDMLDSKLLSQMRMHDNLLGSAGLALARHNPGSS